jgi:hypothetical protein
MDFGEYPLKAADSRNEMTLGFFDMGPQRIPKIDANEPKGIASQIFDRLQSELMLKPYSLEYEIGQFARVDLDEGTQQRMTLVIDTLIAQLHFDKNEKMPREDVLTFSHEAQDESGVAIGTVKEL